jgi:hypothetical protein
VPTEYFSNSIGKGFDFEIGPCAGGVDADRRSALATVMVYESVLLRTLRSTYSGGLQGFQKSTVVEDMSCTVDWPIMICCRDFHPDWHRHATVERTIRRFMVSGAQTPPDSSQVKLLAKQIDWRL